MNTQEQPTSNYVNSNQPTSNYVNSNQPTSNYVNSNQPIIIVNEQGFRLIQELMNMALKGYGLDAYSLVSSLIQEAKSYGQFVMELEKKLKKEYEEKQKNLKKRKE